MPNEYKQMLQKARRDLEAALQERGQLDSRIAALKQTIGGLAPLSGELPDGGEDLVDAVMETAGISNGIRRVLSKSPTPLSAPEIRDALVKKPEYKEKLESYASPLTVIHNTLARLMRQDEVISLPMGFALKEK